MTKRKVGKAAAGRKRVAVADAITAANVSTAAVDVAASATTLCASLDIHGVEANYRQLRALLAGGLPVVVDISGLHSVDTAGLQLLLAVQQEAERRGVPINWRGDSPAFSAAIDRLGFTSTFANARRHG